jgi:hypothetical protein
MKMTNDVGTQLNKANPPKIGRLSERCFSEVYVGHISHRKGVCGLEQKSMGLTISCRPAVSRAQQI